MKKFFGFAKTIILHPGDISYNFINGRQVSLRIPLTLFVIANLLFFAGPKRSDLYTQMNNMTYEHIVKWEMPKNKETLAAYDQRSWLISRLLLVLNVFLFSLSLYFVNYRKSLKYIDHLAVSFEFMALATLYILVIMGWANVLILTLIVAVLLLYAFERMAYRYKPFRAFANAALLVFLFYATLLLYRSCVFFITLLTL